MPATARYTFCGCLLTGLLASSSVWAGKLPDRQTPPAARQLACPWTPPDVDTLDVPRAELDKASADDSDDDDDSVAPVGDKGSSAGPGFLNPGSGCVLIDGEVGAGSQSSVLTTAPTQATGRLTQTTIQSQSNIKLGLTHYSQTEFGDLVTRINFQVDQSNSLTLPYAYMSLGHGTLGLQTSFYDDWQASEFSFRALASAQSPFLAAYAFHPTDATTFSLSIEDPAYRRVTVSGYGPVQYPDAISRLRYFAGSWSFIVNTALHQTMLMASNPVPTSIGNAPTSLWGTAIQGYVKYALPNDAQADSSYAILQVAYAHDAPGYLGLNTTSSAFSVTLPAALNAANMERSVGWNGAFVLAWAWTEKWRSAGFASYVDLKLPDNGSSRSIKSFRSALNLTYTPIENLDFTIEAGYAKLTSTDSVLPSANQRSIILSVSRPFP